MEAYKAARLIQITMSCCVVVLLTVPVPAATADDNKQSKNEAVKPTAGAHSQTDRLAIQGRWSVGSFKIAGHNVPVNVMRNLPIEKRSHPLLNPHFEGGAWTEVDQATQRRKPIAKIALNPSTSPKEIDLLRPQGTLKGIYQLDDESLTLCVDLNPESKARPSEFSTNSGDTRIVLEYVKDSRADKQFDIIEISLMDEKIARWRKLSDSDLAVIEKTLRDERDSQLRMVKVTDGTKNLYSSTLIQFLPIPDCMEASARLEQWMPGEASASLLSVVENTMRAGSQSYEARNLRRKTYVENLNHYLRTVQDLRRKR